MKVDDPPLSVACDAGDMERIHAECLKFPRNTLFDRINAISVSRHSPIVDEMGVSNTMNDRRDRAIPSWVNKRVAGPSQNNQREVVWRKSLEQHPIIGSSADGIINSFAHPSPPTNFSNR